MVRKVGTKVKGVNFFYASFILLCFVLFASACSSSPNIPDRMMPPGVSFTGLWDSNYGQMVLRTSGLTVTGEFEHENGGLIKGELRGGVLVFSWVQSGNWDIGKREVKGHGFFLISDDGEYIEGRWGYDDNYENGGIWRADRASITLEEYDKAKKENETESIVY